MGQNWGGVMLGENCRHPRDVSSGGSMGLRLRYCCTLKFASVVWWGFTLLYGLGSCVLGKCDLREYRAEDVPIQGE